MSKTEQNIHIYTTIILNYGEMVGCEWNLTMREISNEIKINLIIKCKYMEVSNEYVWVWSVTF